MLERVFEPFLVERVEARFVRVLVVFEVVRVIVFEELFGLLELVGFEEV
jgi:hypothetical protein